MQLALTAFFSYLLDVLYVTCVCVCVCVCVWVFLAAPDAPKAPTETETKAAILEAVV